MIIWLYEREACKEEEIITSQGEDRKMDDKQAETLAKVVVAGVVIKKAIDELNKQQEEITNRELERSIRGW